MKPKILIVDDDDSILSMLESQMKALGFESRSELDAAGLREACREEHFSLLLLDLHLPDANGIVLLNEIQQHQPELPVIMITASGEVGHAVEAMRAGAYDYCQKPIDMNRLRVSVKNAIERFELKQQLKSFERIHRKGLCGMIGGSPRMQMVYHMIEMVAPTNAPVLITGESGTGKELVARAIHELSPRRQKELVDLNCAAIPQSLMENELFGHEPHSFTGAHDQYIGRCERANDSTLFLDEIAEMDYHLQAKLLRFLQDYSFFRVGGKQRIQVNTRIVAATNKDPLKAIQDQEFREDLYFRLNVVNIPMPALRDRPEDIPDLSDHFLHQYSSELERPCSEFTESALEVLCNYPWPGNIRELENTIRQAVVLNPQKTLAADSLPVAIQKGAKEPGGVLAKIRPETQIEEEESNQIIPIDVLERNAIEQALTRLHGNVAKASTALNISQATLYRKLKDYGLVLEQFKE